MTRNRDIRSRYDEINSPSKIKCRHNHFISRYYDIMFHKYTVVLLYKYIVYDIND